MFDFTDLKPELKLHFQFFSFIVNDSTRWFNIGVRMMHNTLRNFHTNTFKMSISGLVHFAPRDLSSSARSFPSDGLTTGLTTSRSFND